MGPNNIGHDCIGLEAGVKYDISVAAVYMDGDAKKSEQCFVGPCFEYCGPSCGNSVYCSQLL